MEESEGGGEQEEGEEEEEEGDEEESGGRGAIPPASWRKEQSHGRCQKISTSFPTPPISSSVRRSRAP